MIAGILLAAGESTRFGADKLLQPLSDGRSIVATAAEALHASLPESYAVVRPGVPALSSVLAAAGLTVVDCKSSAEGMAASIACGVKATGDVEGWVVALGDMPGIQARTIVGIVQALRDGAALVAPVFRGQRGHPVGFSRVWRDALLGLSGEQGARGLLQQHRQVLQLIEVDDPGVVWDIDTPEDLRGVARA